MNPFDLPGPEFLVFYICLGSVILFLLYRYKNRVHRNSPFDATEIAKDPYKIAYLRGGYSEAVAVATVALHDRRLLVNVGDQLKIEKSAGSRLVSRPIEKAILAFYAKPHNPSSTPYSALILASCDIYDRELGQQGLLLSSNERFDRLFIGVAAVGLLVACSWIKLSLAIARGHHNIDFLIILTIGFSVAVPFILGGRLTGEGKEFLNYLRTLFAHAEKRAFKIRAGGETNEAALVAAVFGLSVLSATTFPLVRLLQPPPSSSDSSGSSCSSSSSCGSSCGGGCGGCGS